MPNCENNSPMGLGYDPNDELENTTKQGKDGNMWVVGKLKDGSHSWEEYQTYPYVSIILWIKDLKKHYKNFLLDIESLEVFEELRGIIDELEEKEVSYEMGWTSLEIDFELYDNFESLDKSFYEKLSSINKLTSDKISINIEKNEVLLINYKNNSEELVKLV